MPVRSEAPQGLSANIKRLRQKKNMTQQFLAEQVGISPPYMSEIEGSDINVSSVLLKKIADALETTTDELLCREPPQGSLEATLPWHIELLQNCIRAMKGQDRSEIRFETAQRLKLIQDLEKTVDWLCRYKDDKGIK